MEGEVRQFFTRYSPDTLKRPIAAFNDGNRDVFTGLVKTYRERLGRRTA
jgi:hypothetical protein